MLKFQDLSEKIPKAQLRINKTKTRTTGKSAFWQKVKDSRETCSFGKGSWLQDAFEKNWIWYEAKGAWDRTVRINKVSSSWSTKKNKETLDARDSGTDGAALSIRSRLLFNWKSPKSKDIFGWLDKQISLLTLGIVVLIIQRRGTTKKESFLIEKAYLNTDPQAASASNLTVYPTCLSAIYQAVVVSYQSWT